MLDEEKIRLMTQISIYEKEQEHDELVLSHYFREDYVRYGCLRTLIVATLTYWSVVAMYILYRFQELLREINTMDYFDIIGKLMFGYLGFSVILYIYAFVVYHIRFQLAKKGLIRYNRNLKKFLKWEERHASRQEIETGIVQVKDGIGGEELDQIEYNITNRAGKKNVFERKKVGEEAEAEYDAIDAPETEDAEAVKAETENAEAENAEAENAEAENAEAEKSEIENAAGDESVAAAPETENAEEENTESDISETENPETDSSETVSSETETTGTENTETENTETDDSVTEDEGSGLTEEQAPETDTDKNEETENTEEPAHASLEDEGRQ